MQVKQIYRHRGTDRERQGQTGTDRDRPGVPVPAQSLDWWHRSEKRQLRPNQGRGRKRSDAEDFCRSGLKLIE